LNLPLAKVKKPEKQKRQKTKPLPLPLPKKRTASTSKNRPPQMPDPPRPLAIELQEERGEKSKPTARNEEPSRPSSSTDYSPSAPPLELLTQEEESAASDAAMEAVPEVKDPGSLSPPTSPLPPTTATARDEIKGKRGKETSSSSSGSGSENNLPVGRGSRLKIAKTKRRQDITKKTGRGKIARTPGERMEEGSLPAQRKRGRAIPQTKVPKKTNKEEPCLPGARRPAGESNPPEESMQQSEAEVDGGESDLQADDERE
jgi:hypothetical protein